MYWYEKENGGISNGRTGSSYSDGWMWKGSDR